MSVEDSQCLSVALQGSLLLAWGCKGSSPSLLGGGGGGGGDGGGEKLFPLLLVSRERVLSWTVPPPCSTHLLEGCQSLLAKAWEPKEAGSDLVWTVSVYGGLSCCSLVVPCP